MFHEIMRVFGVFLGWPLQLLFFKRKTYYENKKKTHLRKGGKLIVSNHYNMFDYVLACFIVFPRKLFAVAAEFAFQSRMCRFGMKFFGTIEANRETRSMSFVGESAEVIKKGHLVQIFPEGHNTPDGNLHPFHPVYVLIAHRAQSPIVPIVSDGNYGIFKRVRVYIGEEIWVSDYIDPNKKTPTKADLLKVNEVVFNKVAELRAKIEEEKAKEKSRGGKKND